MFRKRTKEQLSKAWDQQIHQIRHGTTPNSSNSRQQFQVTLLMGAQRSPLTIDVPKHCNLKILKSIIWFHLKKILTLTQFNTIVGFENIPHNYQLDYQLEKGIGTLKNSINLVPFLRNSRYGKNSLLCYKICQLISQGGFSKVYLMRNYQNGQFVVGKFIQKKSINSDLVQNQYQIAQDMNNPFIVKTSALIQTQNFYVIIMQYAPGGQLFELLKIHPKMTQKQAKFYIIQTLLALKYLHNQNIIYRDVKPQNIMLDQLGHVKLTDFGLAKKNQQRVYSFCGSLDYMAPQVITDFGYSFEADYYSIGNLLYQLLFGIPPFYQPNASQQQTKYRILKMQLPIPQHTNLSASAIDLLQKLLTKDANKRIGHFGGVDQIFEHSWFSDIQIDDYIMKIVDPPFCNVIDINASRNSISEQEQKQWQSMIDKDIKQLQIKAIYHRKNTHVRRFRSVDGQSLHHPASSLPASPPKQTNSKLKSNMSLLYVLTHKRSNSDFHKKDGKNPFLSSFSTLKSANVSRKTSQCNSNKETRIKLLQSKDQTNLKNNFMNVSKKSKENGGIVKKRKKQICGDRIYFRRS